MNKIFCIGLNKTGTKSIHKAFLMLGFKSVHYKDEHKNNIKNMITQNYLNGNNILKGLEKYDAISDWDKYPYTHLIFKEFDKQYPGSKFILNTRNLNDWLDSREKHVKRNQKLKLENPDLEFDWLEVERDKWEKQYHTHHTEVFEYFKGREQDLLVFDVTKGDAWDKLCPFLDVPIPKEPFPQLNFASHKKDYQSQPTFFQRTKQKFTSLFKTP